MSELVTLDFNDGRKVVRAKPGMSLFAAARVNGLFLPSACGAVGRCGMCRVRLVEGEAGPVTDGEREKLSAADLAAGWRLGCQAKIAGPLKLVAHEDAFNAREYPVVVQRFEQLTHDIRGVRLRLVDGARIQFRAGQYVAFAAKPYPGVKVVPMRAFSIASAPGDGDHVSLVIRRTPNGVATPWVFEHMQVGDATKIVGPFGDFRLNDSDRPALWMAGGSGLSPFLSILQDLGVKGTKRKITLFFGAVTRKDLYLVEHLETFQATHDWFTFVAALSGDPEEAAFEQGLVTDVLKRRVGSLPEAEGYICGSPGMIGAGVKAFHEVGIPDERIFFDRF